ncbi:GTP-binding protein [Methanolobus psychrotolerans]|uniref:GTP-binding protein n=1 Tax=Methanolobus psychrotolerans TaxID=1874706 RepID=UPI000B91AEEF|nr:GTP-binding protein [Methanolobus psychrotolerans]
MQIIIVSGFLGSGKTTSVIRMGKNFKSKGYSVAVLVNDIGDVGVDGQIINKNGLESKEMPRGCICCTLKYALEANISLVQAQYDPDILFIEPTGVAFPLRIKEQIKKMDFGHEISMGPIITLIDGSRFGELMEHSGDAIIRQIQNADIVLLNKKDLLDREQLAGIKATIEDLNPDAQLYALSLKGEEDGAFTSLMDVLESSFGSGISVTDSPGLLGSGTIAVSAECTTACEDDFNHFNVSSYADSYEVKSFLGREAAMSLILDVMQSIRENILDLNPRFLGHLKMFLHTGTVAMRVSVTSYRDIPELEFVGSGTDDAGKFTVFAAVTDVARDSLADIIEEAVLSRSGQLGINV